MRTTGLLWAIVGIGVCAARAHAADVVLDPDVYRDRVYACWLGKSIGGTLGMPVEGARETHDFAFYTPVPTEQLPNDDLDLQLLWLKALEERGPGITAIDLGEYWLQYVPVDWNEYGIGKANMRAGFLPPVSGQFRNRWRDSNGAWIRSEIWACLTPGHPEIAARYAYEDACVDHGAAEGAYAEVFTATVESAAFVEHDRDRLIEIGLSYIPPDCAVATSIAAARAAHAAGLSLMDAREAVVHASESTGWFMAPQNVAFVILGWLYGGGEFGPSICAAVNCGDDTDCTGATLGSILGIIHGSAAIPEEWRKPVGEGIRNVAIAGFQPPATLRELTDDTVRMAPVVLEAAGTSVEFRAGAATEGPSATELLARPEFVDALWGRSPYQVRYGFGGLQATLDYLGEPMAASGQARELALLLTNTSGANLRVTVSAAGDVDVAPSEQTVTVPSGATEPTPLHFRASATSDLESAVRGALNISIAGDAERHVVPFALLIATMPNERNVALERLGAKATSDSELDREPGCTHLAIDGIIPGPDDFTGQRWHAALTPHPHWIMVELPEPRRIARILVHFADPQGHPVDFVGQTSPDGTNWRTVFEESDYTNARAYASDIVHDEMRFFRFTIRRSANATWPDAAQIAEIEFIPE